MAEVLLNQEQIKEIIPHRDPFLLIDEVLEMEVGKRVVARKYIKADDFWFRRSSAARWCRAMCWIWK